MSLHNFRRNYSLNILVRMVVLTMLVLVVALWKADFLQTVYFANQLTYTGWIINGSILAIFLIGLARIAASLIYYLQQEKHLALFENHLELGIRNPLESIPPDSIIAQRYNAMSNLYEKNTPINHHALAATLVASESTRNSFPKFVNNILILTGVFGTIVSLSMALIGASNILESSVATGGMGLIIHGMSTALSTTITAIVCYLFFSYFFTKLTDVQTNLISAVEYLTLSRLMPTFHIQTETIVHHVAGLIDSLHALAKQMQISQKDLAGSTEQVHTLIDQSHRQTRVLAEEFNRLNSQHMRALSEQMESIRQLLREGFRLPDEGRQ